LPITIPIEILKVLPIPIPILSQKVLAILLHRYLYRYFWRVLRRHCMKTSCC